MAITISPIQENFGAKVTGVNLANLDDEDWREIYAAFLKYALLLFPAQHLSSDEQTEFALRFGEIESLVPGTDITTVPISNQKADGSLALADENLYKVLHGNEGWHTDSTYMPVSSKAALLSAHQVPSSRGETQWADMRQAYEDLEAKQQKEISELSAYHSLYHSQAEAGFVLQTGDGYGYHEKGMPLRSLIKVHPETGKRALFVGRHAFDIPGLSKQASKDLLNQLLNSACQQKNCYSHSWEVGDLALWDNRCLLHRAMPYDTTQVRKMLGTRIAGDPATELAPTFVDKLATNYKGSQTNT